MGHSATNLLLCLSRYPVQCSTAQHNTVQYSEFLVMPSYVSHTEIMATYIYLHLHLYDKNMTTKG